MGKRMIIVGAGIAGLSTGCYAQMNGYQTTIFEMHSIPGGLCTAWKRKGYTFDISMHLVTNSKVGPFHQMWRELKVTEERTFHYHQEFSQIESGDKKMTIGVDPRALEEQMLAISPTDAKLTKEFIRLFYGRDMMAAASLKPEELMGPVDMLKMLVAVMPLMGVFRKYGRVTLQEFAERFQDPFLRHAVRFIIDSPGWPMIQYPMVALTGFIKSGMCEAGVPLGGSQQVLFGMEKYYRQLGGEIRYKSQVVDLLIENDRAVGVRLENGAEYRADIIVWAGDGHHVIYDILGGRYLSDEITKMYRDWVPVKPLLHVMLGVARDFSGEPHRVIFELEKPIMIAGEEQRWMSMLHHSFDPGMAPAGKSAVEVWYATRYDFWEDLYRDRERYQAEKKRIADLTIAELDKRWPGLAAQVEVVDVPTPVTYKRYTGNWQGSPDGWYITNDNMMDRKMRRTLPGLSGFHMVGQWTGTYTGTVLAAASGRQLIQLLCKQNGEGFVTSGL